MALGQMVPSGTALVPLSARSTCRVAVLRKVGAAAVAAWTSLRQEEALRRDSTDGEAVVALPDPVPVSGVSFDVENQIRK